MHQRLGYRYTTSLLAGDTVNVWQDIEIRIDPYIFRTSCQISTINKSLDQVYLWSPRHLSNGCSFTSYQLHLPIVEQKKLLFWLFLNFVCLFQTSKALQNWKINTLGFMEKLDMFQELCGKINEFGWWYYRDNPNWRQNAVYLQGVSGRSFCTFSKTSISGTRTSGNEWNIWSDMANNGPYFCWPISLYHDIKMRTYYKLLALLPTSFNCAGMGSWRLGERDKGKGWVIRESWRVMAWTISAGVRSWEISQMGWRRPGLFT